MTPSPAQRVLITAGGSGIGHAMATAFVAAGSRVWITDVDAAALDLCPASWQRSLVDAADEPAVAALFGEIEKSWGRPRRSLRQRRHRRPDRLGGGYRSGRLAAMRVGQSGGCVSGVEVFGAVDETTASRRHCHHLVDRRHLRQSATRAVRGGQVGRHWPDEDTRDRGWPPPYSR